MAEPSSSKLHICSAAVSRAALRAGSDTGDESSYDSSPVVFSAAGLTAEIAGLRRNLLSAFSYKQMDNDGAKRF
jgi:hypothetical protein